MAVAPNRVAQVNQAGAVDAMFLKLFGGEILAAFQQATVMDGRHMVKTIPHGKTAQFPVMGRTTAGYHAVGSEISTSNINHGEKTINIDELLYSSIGLAEIDEFKNHFEARAEYIKQLGEAIAQKYDKQVLQVGVLNARSSATVTDLPGGTVLAKGAGGLDTAAELEAAIREGAQTFDEKYVPDSERSCFLAPAEYYLLLDSDKLVSRDFTMNNGDFASATLKNAGGMEIVKTNNLPSTVIAAETGANNTYDGDFTLTKVLLQHRSAVGTLKLRDLKIEHDYELRYQQNLFLAKLLVGHGGLRPEASIEITAS